MSKAAPLDFLHCAVTRWRSTVARLHWLEDSPAFPQPGFLLRWVGQFFDIYAAQREQTAIIQLTGDEHEFAHLLAHGLTRHETETETETETEMRCRRIVAEEREKREKAREDYARTVHALSASWPL
ncbi:hypothetical protein JYK14_22900 [Siccirubricoccus sp. KC 17139]|uniref:Uncharacterized protein n=1 Tax=Siccirubricoccus soli TaxID=2899147 RepID=A0ABT1DAT3_9PROT|nr:hypothetical protein [Siccirubricoccus soli]MCO6418984.1 hypothetical protein [Siccirubricoccus soli]MCP2685119.1 hypothetical protein [Siccirubricoccus soli]